MALETSILKTVKKALNVPVDYVEFDLDIITHINSVFSTLTQLGVGPAAGFMIEDDSAAWDAFLDGDNRLNNVKSYMYTRVRLLFDPPQNSFHTTALKEQSQEQEWRLNVTMEETIWTDPSPVEETI